MQSAVIIGFVLLACVYAQVSQPPHYKEKYPNTYQFVKQARHPRDVTWDKQVGNGKVFGTLGDKDDGSVYGKAGYKQDFFNDERGKLTGEAYGARVLGPNGDSSFLGGKVNWNNAAKDAEANLELTRQIHGRTGAQADFSKVWNLDKNTRISAGGTVSQADLGRGRPDYGIGAKFEHFFGGH
ncbi:gloverin-like [Maniola hyperantus]|uniref:gloverin-like n=1 Tax=Aphantopus hyperantus TaxID=2795564 RepID=UPI0015680873|nr:gloverin-like [Maniola hyperantus]